MMIKTIQLTILSVLLLNLSFARAQEVAEPETKADEASQLEIKESSLGQTRNVHTCGNLFLAGQPSTDDIAAIQEKGIKRVITLRENGEVDWDEAGKFKSAGIEFSSIPFRSTESLNDDVFSKVRLLLQDSQDTPTMLHCGSANRVGAVWMVHRVLDQGVELEKAIAEAKTIGLRNPAYQEKAIDFIKRTAAKEAAKK